MKTSACYSRARETKAIGCRQWRLKNQLILYIVASSCCCCHRYLKNAKRQGRFSRLHNEPRIYTATANLGSHCERNFYCHLLVLSPGSCCLFKRKHNVLVIVSYQLAGRPLGHSFTRLADVRELNLPAKVKWLPEFNSTCCLVGWLAQRLDS